MKICLFFLSNVSHFCPRFQLAVDKKYLTYEYYLQINNKILNLYYINYIIIIIYKIYLPLLDTPRMCRYKVLMHILHKSIVTLNIFFDCFIWVSAKFVKISQHLGLICFAFLNNQYILHNFHTILNSLT